MSSHQLKGSSKKGRESEGGSADSIKVVCRFRPPVQAIKNRRESVSRPGKIAKEDAKIDSFKLNEERNEVEVTSEYSDNKMFTFDKVFGVDTTQIEVFNEVSGVVQSVMAGFNGTVMAYGQTSAGKSWTMEGSSIWDTDSQGVIPRCIDSLFDEINNSDPEIQFQVTISYFEIYCEKVRDLLNPAMCNMKIRETKTMGFIIQDVTEIACTDRDSVLKVIEMGKTNRAAAPTLMNAESSRSHSIVSILVDQRHTGTGRNKSGRLFLVDLAGSEKVGKTGATGVRLEEAKNINGSLTTLGMVINALCDHLPHVPYRDSKLTMLLMDALGGNSKTTLIICCTPELKHTPETITTLRFGERAKRIKTHAKINEELSVEELKSLLAASKKEIALLKKKIANLLTGVGGLGGAANSSFSSVSGSPVSGSLETGVDEDFMALANQKSFHLDNQEDCTAADELLSLKTQLVSVQEELEVEKIRYKDEHENAVQYTQECEALRATIEELEAKLLKASLENRRMTVDGADASGPNSLRRLSADAIGMSLSFSDKQGSSNVKFQPSASAIMETSECGDSVHTASMMDIHSTTAAAGWNTASETDAATHDSGAEFDEYGNPMLHDEASEAYHDGEGEGGGDSGVMDPDAVKSQELAADMLKLNEQSVKLRNALESEIKGLERNLSYHVTDTKDAQATAQSYAEKYLRLREEYESHVQRLMFKLTQEQQARTHVEDRLEDALHRLWRQSGKTGKSKGFFASFFGAAKDTFGGTDATHAGSGAAGAGGRLGNFKESPSMTPRELDASRNLELAQFKIAQLVSELESNKEAQAIVLETKESVMRSLARQNSQLTIERDNYQKRAEDLTQTVDQLTNLLRSVQSRKAAASPSGNMLMSPRSALNRNASFIQGGGLKRGTSRFNFSAIETTLPPSGNSSSATAGKTLNPIAAAMASKAAAADAAATASAATPTEGIAEKENEDFFKGEDFKEVEEMDEDGADD